jgi:hypothetical protein
VLGSVRGTSMTDHNVHTAMAIVGENDTDISDDTVQNGTGAGWATKASSSVFHASVCSVS